MKLIIFFFMLSTLSASVLDKVRNHFPEINSVEEAEFYLKLLENEKSPESQAYYAAMLFMKSKYVKFPLTKYKYFKKGKTALDQLIQENKTNVEMRYLRFVFQNEMPNFLNYNSDIQEDFLVITKGIEKSDLNREFKHKMLKNMLLVKNVTADQTTKIKLLINKL
jgi:hypothetical protein